MVANLPVSTMERYRLVGEILERQPQNIQTILQLHMEMLDLAYQTTAAASLRVSDLLQRALAEAAV